MDVALTPEFFQHMTHGLNAAARRGGFGILSLSWGVELVGDVVCVVARAKTDNGKEYAKAYERNLEVERFREDGSSYKLLAFTILPEKASE